MVTTGIRGPATPYDPTRTDQVVSALLANPSSLLFATLAERLGLFFPETYGAVGDGVHDDSVGIQAAIDAAGAKGAGEVHFRPVTYNYSSSLVQPYSKVKLVFAEGSVLSYTGTGAALTFGSKTGSVINRTGLRGGLTLTAPSASIGLAVIATQFSVFEDIRVDSMASAGAIGVVLDTQSIGGFSASINNTFIGGFIQNCYHGIKLTRDPAKDAAVAGGTASDDGCNHNLFVGTRVSGFTGIGFNVDHGENVMLDHVDSSTSNALSPLTPAGTIGIRVNDDVCTLVSPRADNSSAGAGLADVYGIYVTANGSDVDIVNPTGNGPKLAQRVFFEDEKITRNVRRQSFNQRIGNFRESTVPVGANFWSAKARKNISGSTIGLGEVGYTDSTCGEGEVKRSAAASATTAWNPKVAVENVTTTSFGGFALPGSIATFKCDTGAVAVGDQLVPSTVTNGSWMGVSPATVVNQRLVGGIARQVKAAGAAGNITGDVP